MGKATLSTVPRGPQWVPKQRKQEALGEVKAFLALQQNSKTWPKQPVTNQENKEQLSPATERFENLTTGVFLCTVTHH